LYANQELNAIVDTSFQEGEEAGIEKGIEQGRKSEKIALAKKSLKEGLSIELISKLTGLPKEEVKKL